MKAQILLSRVGGYGGAMHPGYSHLIEHQGKDLRAHHRCRINVRAIQSLGSGYIFGNNLHY